MAPHPPSTDIDHAAYAQLTREWDVRGIDMTGMAVDERGTLARPGEGTVVPRSEHGSGTLTPDRQQGAASQTAAEPIQQTDVGKRPPPTLSEASARELDLHQPIGEGGMGVVWEANQLPLSRDVAVKGVHPLAPQEEATKALLREALVTGSLEHPHVVPIHMLARDAHGKPLIVMKRIEGSSWAAQLRTQHHFAGEVSGQLEHHVHVLIDLAKALHFAHCRGIVHRDVKPDNVMIGTFGEVYLVDWGLAASLHPDSPFGAPWTAHIDTVHGSPAYMAPEMVAGDGARIGPRTDVYLLGATLHEVLTGAPPHAGGATFDMLTRAYISAPHQYESSVPAGLIEICQRAMQRLPEDRHASAAAVAAALRRFLKTRDSETLTVEGEQKLEHFRDALAVAGGGAPSPALHNLFNECRFAFVHALRIWQKNGRALAGLQETLELMIDSELSRGASGSAAILMSDLPRPVQRLADRISEQESAEIDAGAELARLKRQLDPTAGDSSRVGLSLAVALAWPLLHLALYLVQTNTTHEIGHREMAATYSVFVLTSVSVGIANRDVLLARARAGLATQLTGTLVYLALALCWVLGGVLGLQHEATFTLSYFVSLLLWTSGAVSVDGRMLTWAMAMLAGLWMSLFMPRYNLLWLGGLGALASGIYGILRYRTRAAREPLPLSEHWAHSTPAATQDDRAHWQ